MAIHKKTWDDQEANVEAREWQNCDGSASISSRSRERAASQYCKQKISNSSEDTYSVYSKWPPKVNHGSELVLDGIPSSSCCLEKLQLDCTSGMLILLPKTAFPSC